ncbi:hypothetical protein OR16_17002 [Cupriavidus basilensis OR16]|uniref:Uncharacterized protein n=1 Tax=Cupriavidus basilensis OR16 TaxID=1127483 RepID=H1S690_9BURK|nr:hypothetical protein [Cupriavidus basilensis]EHP41914.1 hypothetical protein OR16_17002 [Cupriavidus basilensis OR16]
MRKQTKQSWEVGQQVKVGFLVGLTVIAKIPTPGDFAPDAYVLVRGEQFYAFVPHNGISKIDPRDGCRGQAPARGRRGPRVGPSRPRHCHRQARRRAYGCLRNPGHDTRPIVPGRSYQVHGAGLDLTVLATNPADARRPNANFGGHQKPGKP